MKLPTVSENCPDAFQSHQQNQSTLILLKADVIEVVLVQSGSVIQRLPTLNLQENMHIESVAAMTVSGPSANIVAAGMGRQTHKSLATPFVRTSSTYNNDVREAEGKPSAIHWCGITHLILVGFTTGGIGLLSLSGAIHSTLPNQPNSAHVPSNTKHRAEITTIITFHHKLERPLSLARVSIHPPPPKDVVIALIGDANGAITLWQIYPDVK